MKTCLRWGAMLLVLASVRISVVAQELSRPKLVVGLVVDQMRWDYLYRYYSRYGSDGFKRLLGQGFSCENTFMPFTPTYTAAGHSCVYTGSVPAMHGIMGNNWYDRSTGKVVYCTDDATVTGVGSSSAAGKMSPRNMWSNTITDEIRLAQNFRSKTVAVALKDRGSILPGGFTANGAYWFDDSNGSFITSTFYMNELPAWVNSFNARKLPDAYMKQPWTPLYPLNTYIHSTADSKSYEGKLPGGGNTFPHKLDSTKTNKYSYFRYLPFANTFTLDMAKAAIAGEGLGKQQNVTDFLAVSLSSPDYLGHTTGPNSIEIEDMYLRLDKDLAGFLAHLDATVGKGQYLLFLTADHGVANVPGFVAEHKMPTGVTDDADTRTRLNAGLQKNFNAPDLIASIINYQVYLNYDAIANHKLDKKIIKQQIIDSLMKSPGIARAFDLEALPNTALPQPVHTMLTNGYNQRLSGDIQFMYKPQWFDGWSSGTTHGAWNPYDAHIPLIWFGWNIKAGKSNREVYMTDIAPTLAALLRVQMPNANIGKPITEVTQ